MGGRHERRERTDDPKRLAFHIGIELRELADSASADIENGRTLDHTDGALWSLYKQLSALAQEVQEHRGAIHDSQKHGWSVEFDVFPEQSTV